MSDIKLPRRLDLSVQYACNRDGVPSRVEFRRWLRAAEPGAARITVRIVDEDEGRELNRDYRAKDYATKALNASATSGVAEQRWPSPRPDPRKRFPSRINAPDRGEARTPNVPA